MSEYQNRKDIDKIFDDFYEYRDKTKVVCFKNDSVYRSISTELNEDKSDDGTIDAIMEYYRLNTVADTVDGLSNTTDDLTTGLSTLVGTVNTLIETAIYDLIYPIGSVYQTTDDSFNPNTAFNGLWENISEENDEIYKWERVSEA